MRGKRIRNTLVSVVLEIALVFCALLGCGREKPEPYDDAVQNKNSGSNIFAEKENSDDDLTGGRGPVIRVATWYDDSYTPNLRAYLAQQFPYYDFKFIYIEKSHYKNIIDAQLSFNGAPDIIFVDHAMAKTHAMNGHIIPLTDICGNFSVEGLTAFWYDRDTYAVPSTTCFQCMYVNKGIFDKYELKVPQNADDFIAMCAFIEKTANIKAISAGMKDYETISTSALSILQGNYFGTEYGGAFGTRLKYGRSIFYKDLYEYMQDWEEMIQEGILSPDMYMMDKKAAIAEFVAGESLLLVAGPEDYNRIRVANPQMEISTLPLGWGRYGAFLIGGCDCGFAVNANSTNVTEAKEVVRTLASKDGQFAIWKDRVGSRTYLRKTEFTNPPAFDGIKDIFYTNQLYMPVQDWGEQGMEINLVFGKELQYVLIGEEPLNMALMNIDIKVNNMKKAEE